MDAALLEYEMKRKGVSTLELCKHLGIARSTFWKKCNGRSEFKQSEIQSICKFLSIEDPAPIFFTDQVS